MRSFKPFVSIFLLTALWGCGGGQSDPPTTGAGGQSVSEKLYVSVSGEGAVKSVHIESATAAKGGVEKTFHHAEPPTTIDATINVKSTAVPDAKPGEIVFSEGFAYVRLSDTDPAHIHMFDVASDGVDHNHPIPLNGQRPVHMYVDPDEKVWALNDGPRPPQGVSCPGTDPACEPDTVSVIDKGTHQERTRITVGSGHHKAAFSKPSPLKLDVPKRAFVSNIHDDTISAIDNDPASLTYLQVIFKNHNAPNLNGDASLLVGDNPHGIDFSPVSGMVYNSNTRDTETNVVSIIDAETLAVTHLTRGFEAGQIPASGAVHTRHVHDDPTDGQYVYILGAVKDTKGDTDPANDTTTGYVSVIDAFNADTVIARTPLPGVNPDHITFTPDGKKAYLTSRSGFGTPTPDLKNNVVVVLNTDPASPNFNQVIKEVPVGKADAHRPAIVISSDGHLAFVANSGTGESTVSVIDTTTDAVVSTIDVGASPSGLGIVSAGSHAH